MRAHVDEEIWAEVTVLNFLKAHQSSYQKDCKGPNIIASLLNPLCNRIPLSCFPD